MTEDLNTIAGIQARRQEYEKRMSGATRRILEVSTELHLTWEELEDVLERVKGSAYICVAPAETKDAP